MSKNGHILVLMVLAALALTLRSSVALAQTAPASTPPSSSPAQPAAYQTQMIYFGRGGKSLSVELAPTMAPMNRAALFAFGRIWGEAVATRKPDIKVEADFAVPAVRVPTVFTIAHPEWPNQYMGYIVAYPDRDIEWDKKVALYSYGTPAWFNQWAAATGLPIKPIASANMAVATLPPADERGKSLLILGASEPGKDPTDAMKLARDKKVNVLILDADWFGPAAGSVKVAPAQMLGGLSEIAKQHWPQPLHFANHRKPWPGIANRWTWIVDEKGLPLVELLNSVLDKDRPNQAVCLSYVPWDTCLGRDESADSAFLSLLTTAANAVTPVLGGYHGVSVTGRPRELLAERVGPSDFMGSQPFNVSPDRPVLSAVISRCGATDMGPRQLDILDIRGNQALTQEMRDFVERPIVRGWGRKVLILGDDKLLDEWQWLKLNRAKKTIDRPEIVWLADDELPPSNDSQVKLMLTLTELGVPLVPPANKKGADKP